MEPQPEGGDARARDVEAADDGEVGDERDDDGVREDNAVDGRTDERCDGVAGEEAGEAEQGEEEEGGRAA